MRKILLVIDMQNDFIDGALGTPEAQAIVPNVKKMIEDFDGLVLFTRDSHGENYLESQEGKNLPVPHCIKGTDGWKIRAELDALRDTEAIDKLSFGSSELGEILLKYNAEEAIESITVIGLCTDICVISNVMIAKAFLPEVPVIVYADCCAGVSPQTHENALNAMELCQVKVVRAKVECVDDKNVLAPVRKRLKLEARLNGQEAPKGYTVEDWGKPVGRETR